MRDYAYNAREQNRNGKYRRKGSVSKERRKK
jgi:hypothetical protein